MHYLRELRSVVPIPVAAAGFAQRAALDHCVLISLIPAAPERVVFDFRVAWRREREIGFALQNRSAITFGAPSPLRSVETSHPSFAVRII